MKIIFISGGDNLLSEMKLENVEEMEIDKLLMQAVEIEAKKEVFLLSN